MEHVLLKLFNRVKIDIYDTTEKMLSCFYCCCVVSILPKCSLSILPLIVFLPRSTCDELYGSRNDLSITIVGDKKVNVVGGDHIVQDCQTIAPPGLIEPVKPSSSVLGKLQKKFPLMASVGDLPR